MEGAHEKARKAHGPQYGNRGGKPCMYYRQGKCWTGDRCDFIHGEPEHTNQTRGKEFGDNISQETRESTSGQNASSATFGNRPFSPLPTNTDLARCVGKQCVRDNNPSPSIAKAQDKICWKWQAGKCTWGNKCRYSHPPRQTDANAERPAGHQRTHTRVKRTVQAPMSPIVAKAKKPDDQKANISRQQAVRDTIAQQEAARREAESKASGEARQREIIQQETIRKRAMEEALEAAKQHEIQIQQEVIRRREMEKKAMEAARQREIQIQQEAIQRREMEKKATEAARRRSIQMQQEAIRKAKNLAEEALRAEREAAYTAQHIVHGSTTLITCEAGVSIRRVVSGFESCRITVKNLPLNAKPDEIIALFTQQGVVRDDIFIHRIIPNGKHLEATVLTNKTQGSLIAIGLDGVEFKNERLCFETTENFISSDTMGEASGNNADVLTVIWRVPSVTMIATYDDLDVARERARTLDNTICGGRRVRVEMNQPPTGPAFKYYSQSSIKITGLPLDVTTSTVEEFCGTWQIRALKSTAYDLQECLTVLRQHLEGLADSGMRVFDITYPRGQDNQISVRARFETWEHAQRAHDSLDRKRLRSTYPIFRLVIPMPLQFVSTVTSEQYHAQKRIWDSLTSQETNKGCHIRINENHNGKVFIRLVGKEKKAVGAMKVRVETLVAGEKLDSTFWHESFRFPKGKRFLAKVYTDTGVYLRCDWKVRALRMHGDGNEREAARQMVADEIARLSLLEFVIILKRQAVGYLVRTGLAALKEILGEDAVKLDLTSTPCKLTLRGGEEARHALNALLEKSVDMPLARTGEGGDICPICYDDVSHPVKLSCEHVYCTACLRHYLTSAVDTKIFPLACMGDENKCKWPIPIPVIQRFLIQAQYEHLVDVAFATYLDQHPEEFRYCTTPDCTQIYRCNAENALKCPSCFAEVCSSCHEEAHEGMTCAERKNRQGQEEERLNNDWAALNGVKKCPSCQVWIEKTAGCNHMTCRCGAHICWRCMGVFSREEIYPHLTNVHGGIQDEDVPNVRQNDDQQVARDLQRQFDEERNRWADPIRVRHDFQAPLPVFRQQEEDIQGARFHQAALEALRMRRVVEAREIQAAQQAEQARRQANYQRAQALHQAEQARREAHYQRLVDARQQEAERRQKEGGWGCVVM